MSKNIIAERLGLKRTSREKGFAEILEGLHAKPTLATFGNPEIFFPLTSTIAGVDVRPLRVIDYAQLAVSGSPVIVQGETAPEELAVFLWQISTSFRAGDAGARQGFIQQVASVNLVDAATDTLAYLRGIFGEAHCDHSGKPRALNVRRLVMQLAMATGWSESEILNLPLQRALAYLAEISSK